MLRTLRHFRANQGLLLAGAVAYYALLSIVPLLILMVIALSHVIEPASLLATLSRYLEWLLPGQSRALVSELASFLANRGVIGWVLLASMVFFSSLAFTVLENAMSVIFVHRVAIRRRHFAVSRLSTILRNAISLMPMYSRAPRTLGTSMAGPTTRNIGSMSRVTMPVPT
ncbi:ribonuclease [Cupriavidus basilensis OR16]|uniref:Ribonuclease n=1 Tax=Cupriavidus basilensis OR16 TaxID=1127483 RepID=H1SHA1_9BURK|nr:ribonuclease [Cupriavidus basilensis OR16]